MNRRFGRAWLALTLALACHVTDEALTGFLDVYNPIVLAARARFGWFPMPTFAFWTWLLLLIGGILLLLLVTPAAYRGNRVLRVLAWPFAAIMFMNGIGHLAASLYLRRWAPGATTAPLLLGASFWMFTVVRARADR